MIFLPNNAINNIGIAAPIPKNNMIKKLLKLIFCKTVCTITAAKIGPAQGVQMIPINPPNKNPLMSPPCGLLMVEIDEPTCVRCCVAKANFSDKYVDNMITPNNNKKT